MKIAIIGSRKWPASSMHLIDTFINRLSLETTIISGGAIGVDQRAIEAADRRGMNGHTFRPEYTKWPPKIAPLKRNETIIDASDCVVAFWDGQSRGTIHACKYARYKEKTVTVYRPDGNLWKEEEWSK